MTINDQVIRVLIVDDDPGQYRLAEILLEAAGMCVVGTAADGVDALPCAERLRPDVVLIDYQMPLLDGIAASRLLRATGFGPVILATGGDHAGITPAALEAGTALVLAKDTLVNDLEGAIRQPIRTLSRGSTL